jgi:hypothetical protein
MAGGNLRSPKMKENGASQIGFERQFSSLVVPLLSKFVEGLVF